MYHIHILLNALCSVAMVTHCYKFRSAKRLLGSRIYLKPIKRWSDWVIEQQNHPATNYWFKAFPFVQIPLFWNRISESKSFSNWTVKKNATEIWVKWPRKPWFSTKLTTFEHKNRQHSNRLNRNLPTTSS